MLERVLFAEKIVKQMNSIPSKRNNPSVAMTIHVSEELPEDTTYRKHYAKMTMSPKEFKETFSPDNPYITYLDASFFGNELRYEHNNVIVDCMMSDTDMKEFYGDLKLAKLAAPGSRLY